MQTGELNHPEEIDGHDYIAEDVVVVFTPAEISRTGKQNAAFQSESIRPG
jgi:hypothetical protein